MKATTVWIPTVADAARCRRIELEAYGRAATLKQWQQLLKSKSVVALSTRSAVAVARFSDSGYHLLLVAVKSDSRRQGIGRELVRLLGEGKRELLLRLPETNLAALKFAVAAGFKPMKLERNSYSHCDGILLKRLPTV